MIKAGKILVTGGVGYIGSHTVVELLEKNYEVCIVDNLSNSKPEVLESIEKITSKKPEFTELDLCNREALENFFSKSPGISAIIHFAAYKAVGESVEKPIMYYRNNLISLINISECAVKYGVDSIVFSSSCTVYGQPNHLPVTEESPIIPAFSPYGFTKQMGETILNDLTRSSKCNVISLRYFNPIGAHPSALIGEYPVGVPNNLVPFITQTAIGIRPQLVVYGSDYNTPDGSCVRDYINVVDLAKAHVLSIERLLNKKNQKKYEVFNIGTGQGTSVFEVINAFEAVSGVKLNYKLGQRRPGDVECIYADNQLAKTELGWKPQTTLEETLLSAWNWERNLHGKT